MGNKLEDEIMEHQDEEEAIKQLKERLNSEEFKGYCNGPDTSTSYWEKARDDWNLICKVYKLAENQFQSAHYTLLNVCKQRCRANVIGTDQKTYCLYEVAHKIIENVDSIVN